MPRIPCAYCVTASHTRQNPAVDEAAWNADWYREKATNQEVVAALKDKPDGAFVIRDSTTEADSFAISYRCDQPISTAACSSFRSGHEAPLST